MTACLLPKGFDGEKGRRLIFRHASEAARQLARASAPHSTAYSLVLIGLLPLSPVLLQGCGRRQFPGAKSSPPSGRARYGGGSTTVLAGLATMSMPSSPRQRKVTAHKAERYIVHVCEAFHSFSLDPLSKTLQHWSQRQPGYHRPHRVPLLDPTGASDRPGLPGVHPEKDASWSRMIAFRDTQQRGRWNAVASLSSPFIILTVLKGLDQSARTSQLSILPCSACALIPACSTPPGTATPFWLTWRLAASSCGRHCRKDPRQRATSTSYVPTLNGRHFPPYATTLDWCKSLP